MESSIKVPSSMPENFKPFEGHLEPLDETCSAQIAFDHPIKQSELKYDLHKHNLNMQILRNQEGLAAPLKITMELQSVNKVGRLPFLPSSNALRDSLTGRDERIEFSDFLNTEENSELMRQPHAVVEKSLGLL
uniref:Putative proteasome maturation protein n=1 Tax=Corethrella appendiculata TaxID=1370023 RepID=U5ES71_9DIPT